MIQEEEEEVSFQPEAKTVTCIFRNYINTFCISFQIGVQERTI